MTSRFLIFLACLLANLAARAQISEGGLPPSFLPENQALVFTKKIEPVLLQFPEMEKIRAEDRAAPFQGRFAVPVPADIRPENAGVWADLPDSTRLWRCPIKAPGARGLVLIFDEFQLAPGSRFFAYDAQKRSVLGAYTPKSCQSNGKFLLGPLPGETAVLELVEPAKTGSPKSKIHLHRADFAYHEGAMAEAAAMLGFGDGLPCHINVNCPAGAPYANEKRGVARILMVFSNGTGWCTGTLMGNSSGEGIPYFLTAQHCEIIGNSPDFAMWRFDFWYEGANCTNPGIEPPLLSVLGCERVAARAETDFLLLKINPIPRSFDAYYNGWSRAPAPPTSSALIHHPKGDLKKISLDAQAATVFNQQIDWSPYGITPPNTHFKTIPETGTFQPGSSGCPLFDQNRRVVGQLHGGNASGNNPCTVLNTYFGIFNLSWDAGTSPQTRLKDWLDPLGTNAMAQDGYDAPAPPPPPTYSISGKIQTPTGAPMPDVEVTLTGASFGVGRTGANGIFTIGGLPPGNDYTITPKRDTTALNGVSTFDLLTISKHLLGVEPLNSPWKIVACDVNLSKTVSTFDIVEIRKVILGLYPDGFPLLDSWRFFQADANFTAPQTAFPLPPHFVIVQNLQGNVTGINFTAVKTGDSNFSAVPGQ